VWLKRRELAARAGAAAASGEGGGENVAQRPAA